MSYVKNGAICKANGCTKEHYGKSKYCQDHAGQGRINGVLPSGTKLAEAQALLRSEPEPVRLRPAEPVRVLNLRTWATEATTSNAPQFTRLA